MPNKKREYYSFVSGKWNKIYIRSADFAKRSQQLNLTRKTRLNNEGVIDLCNEREDAKTCLYKRHILFRPLCVIIMHWFLLYIYSIAHRLIRQKFWMSPMHPRYPGIWLFLKLCVLKFHRLVHWTEIVPKCFTLRSYQLIKYLFNSIRFTGHTQRKWLIVIKNNKSILEHTLSTTRW